MIGKDGLSRDLPLYLPGLGATLSFASLSVRSPFLDLLERYFVKLNPKSLRPAMKSIILALLPGLEEETSEDFDRTFKLLETFKVAIRSSDSEEITPIHSSGDDFFWQCFFLASITSQSRRPGALAYLVRCLPKLAPSVVSPAQDSNNGVDQENSVELTKIVTSPEPGLLLRCFAAGLSDDQLLIQRGFLDLLVTHLPLHSSVLQNRVKNADLELLLRAATGVVIRREMSLNRRLWAWLLGPNPGAEEDDGVVQSPTSPDHQGGYFAIKTRYFEEYGLQPLIQALLGMINHSGTVSSPSERARPYRMCLSLMDRWEIGGLVVPEVFLPIVDSVRQYKTSDANKADFNEVLKSASVFFDGVESGLIYGEMVGLLAQAIGPGNVTSTERMDKLKLVNFILANFSVREEEMITIHAPLTTLAVLCMLEDAKERYAAAGISDEVFSKLSEESLAIAALLLDLAPERAFPNESSSTVKRAMDSQTLHSLPNLELLKRIKAFYVNEQGNLDSSAPFSILETGELLLQKACSFICQGLSGHPGLSTVGVRTRLLVILLPKVPQTYGIDTERLIQSLHKGLCHTEPLKFTSFSSILTLSTHLYAAERVSTQDLSGLVAPLVRHAWSYLSASEPKYHVESVRNLWQLQTALSPENHDVEAAIAGLMVEHDVSGAFAARPADSGRRFSVLWSHTLQDSHQDRRGSKTPIGERPPQPRLSGADHYDVMLTRPLFLMLDALLDERTQLFMTVKTWLSSLVGIDK
jgi:hypothetical protein